MAEYNKGKKAIRQDPLWELYGKEIEPRWRQLVYWGGIAGLVIVIGALVYGLFSMRITNSQKALAQALEIYNADVAKPAGAEAEAPNPNKRTYPDEKQKYQEAATAFDNVATNHATYKDIASYYAALSRTHFDPAKAQTDLEILSKNDSDIGFWSRLGLAELYAATGQTEKGIEVYKQLKTTPGPLPKAVLLYNLGRLYERANKSTEAVDVYLESIKMDSASAEGRQSRERLNLIDPAAISKLPPEPDKKPEDDF